MSRCPGALPYGGGSRPRFDFLRARAVSEIQLKRMDWQLYSLFLQRNPTLPQEARLFASIQGRTLFSPKSVVPLTPCSVGERSRNSRARASEFQIRSKQMMDRDQFWLVCIDTFCRGVKSRRVSLGTFTWSPFNLTFIMISPLQRFCGNPSIETMNSRTDSICSGGRK